MFNFGAFHGNQTPKLDWKTEYIIQLGIGTLNYFVNSFLNLTPAVFNRDTDCLSLEYLVRPCPPTQQRFQLSLFPTWLLADNEQPCHHQI